MQYLGTCCRDIPPPDKVRILSHFKFLPENEFALPSLFQVCAVDVLIDQTVVCVKLSAG